MDPFYILGPELLVARPPSSIRRCIRVCRRRSRVVRV